MADGRPQSIGRVLSLPAGTTKLEFRYAAISFLMPRFLRYRQQLQGMDHNWVDRGNQRSVQYTNLKAGRYRFQVNVAAPGLGQNWSPQITTIQIEIQPRLWERPWVLVLAALASLLLLWALVRWRLFNLHQRATQLEQLVGQRTSDLQEHADRLRISDQEKSALLERLREMGEWLRVNGEAIYGTRPLAPYKEGRVAFTRRGDAAYAITLAEDEEERPPQRVAFTGLRPAPGSAVYLLGVETPLAWRCDESGVTIDIPPAVREAPPCRHAWVLKLMV